MIKLTTDECKVLLDGLNAIEWESLPEWHNERKAAKTAKEKIEEERLRLIARLSR